MQHRCPGTNMDRNRRRGRVARLVRAVASLAAVFFLWVSCSHATPGPAPVENYDTVTVGSEFEGLTSSFAPDGDDHRAPPPQPPPPPESHWDLNSDPRLSCPTTAKGVDHFLLVVSTIDGAVSALDMRTSGDLLWSVKADERPLLSSSITNIQVTRDGVSTRLIPSLDGGLYEFDGEDIKALPMTADSLLSSSLRITDNSVMVGGKEVGSYGVDVLTGELSYQCTAAGCEDTTEAANNGGDMLLITRSMQTVRAVDVNSGSEKWNFSVGQHELLFVQSQKDHPGIEHDYDDMWNTAADDDVRVDTCFSIDDEEVAMEEAHLKQLIKVVVSDGLIVGLNPEDPTQMAWSRKFSSPVAKAWILHRGKLESISLFDSKVVPSLSSSQQSFQHQRNSRGDPLLYVGTHKRQLYVQKEDADYNCEKELPWMLEQEVERQRALLHVPRVTWRPYVTKSHTPLFLGNEQPQVPLLDRAKFAQDVKEEQQPGNSLTVWHENYPFDMGYYLYPSRLTGGPLHMNLEPAKEEGIMDVLPASLWMWWKEVVAISLLVSLAVHLLLTYVVYRPVRVVVTVDSGSVDKKDSSASLVSNESSPTLLDERSTAQEFKSRFADEFDCMEQLGKGGYGIVFRARNKVDEQEYAVKRIALPNRDGAVKKKMLREVRTLAMLDHVGIVRYFHSWIEDPPLGWQDERDRAFRDMLGTRDGLSPTTDVTLASTTDPHSHSLSPHPPSPAPLKRPSAPGRQPSSVLANIMPFRPETWDQNADFPSFRGCSDSFTGSGEFSRHSNVEGSTDESGSFSLGAGEEVREVVGGEGEEEESRDSLSIVFQHSSEAGSNLGEGGGDEASRNGDPAQLFGRYSSGNGGSCLSSSPGSPKDAGSNEESLSIVFEDSQGRESNSLLESSSIGFGDAHRKGNKDCSQSSSIVFEGSRGRDDKDCSQSSSIVFEDAGGRDDKGSSGPHQQSRSAVLSDSSYGGSVDDNEHEDNNVMTEVHAIDITLSSHSGGEEQQGAAVEEKEEKEGDQRAVKPAEKRPKLYLYLQMQLCQLETLKDWLISNTLSRERTVILDIFEQIVSAVDYVHAKGLIHRDLKPSNIFFALDNTVKVGDFGLVTAPENQGECSEQSPLSKASAKHTAEVGTQLYMSPEQVQKKAYDQKVDIFSLGLIFLELLMPFSTGMERVTTLQKARKGVFPERFLRELPVESALVRQLTSSKPEMRPTTLEVLEHSLLKDLNHPPRRHGGSRYRSISSSSNHSDPALFAEQ